MYHFRDVFISLLSGSHSACLISFPSSNHSLDDGPSAWLSDNGWVGYPFTAIVYFPLVRELSGDLSLFKVRWHTEIGREIGILYFFALGMIILILGNKSGRKMIWKSTRNTQPTTIKEN